MGEFLFVRRGGAMCIKVSLAPKEKTKRRNEQDGDESL